MKKLLTLFVLLAMFSFASCEVLGGGYVDPDDKTEQPDDEPDGGEDEGENPDNDGGENPDNEGENPDNDEDDPNINGGGDTNEQPSNQIWYTTTNSEVVDLNLTYWDIRVVSNEYEDGMGIVTFDRSLDRVGCSVFALNETLASVKLPKSVTTIEMMAFHSCLQLSEVVLEDGVKSIGEDAFGGCWMLKHIDLPSSLEVIGSGAFRNSGLEEISIPRSVVEIGDGAFGTLVIEHVTIPSSVKRVGQGAFQRCEELLSVKIEGGVEEIAPYAFNECKKLNEVSFGEGLKSIGEYAFNCTSIENITIPSSVESIGGYAFIHYGWGTAQKMDVFCKPTTPPTASFAVPYEWRGFSNRSDTALHIYVPASSEGAYESADGWSEYASIIMGYEF